MRSKIEENFVEKFVVKSRRDRLLFELCGKKRANGIGRFCHNADEMLLQEKIIEFGNHLHHDEIIKIIEQYAVPERWHIIAFNKSIDGMSCKLSEALDLVLGNGMAAIIVSDTMAIVESEQCTGTPARYILHD
ncbi:MAG: hypothetical protein IJ512_02465 [Ruminococcus sp.]|nr:hypothetical protein [Ruminococcus sp.]